MRNKTVIFGLGLGMLGGLVGTILMDIVMITTFALAGEPLDLFFTKVGERLGDGAILGIAVHDCIGTTGGFAFSLIVLNFGFLELTSIRKGLMLGVAAGAITIPLGCIPMAIWLGESIVGVLAFSILPHLVWGTVLGLIAAYAFARFKIPPVRRPVQTVRN